MAETPSTLAGFRTAIDSVDDQLLALICERARLAKAVGHLKEGSNAPVWRPEREAQIIKRLRQANEGPLAGERIESIWREIISGCREIERRLRVAFLGPSGTFSEIALLKQFGHGVEPVSCSSIDEVFRTTESQQADFGIVPVENSSEGAVNRSLDLMLQSALVISAEVSLPVKHNLLSQSTQLESIAKVCAHPQALAQCAGWLDKHLPHAQRVPVSSNAEGARLASLSQDTAGIASELAAERYALNITRGSIQDDPHNRTRFAVIGRYACAASGMDQTSLILSVPDKAGAVHSLIEPLARHGVSMKRFESRPARQGTWEYYFYIDVLGHQSDAAVAAALDELRQRAAFIKIIGSYPRASDETDSR
ncbi:MAG: prephenate dehydratase [Burkholderiales bacterium]|jgi:chorismate mutase/prephenate dehydratase